MATRRITLAGLALALAAGGCGAKDAMGPNLSLSLEEVGTLAQELSAVLTSVNIVGAPSVRGGLAQAARARIVGAGSAFDTTANCPGGGTGAIAGSYDTTATTMSADAKLTYTGCRTAHYTTSGSIQANGTYTLAATLETIQAKTSGELSVTTVDGRSGICAVDLTLNATAAPYSQPVYVVTGSACGLNLSGTYR